MTVADGMEAADPSLGQRLDAVQSSLETLERAISEENRLRSERIAKAEKATRWLARACVLCLLIAVVAVIVAVRAISVGNEAHDAQKATAAATADARLGACQQQRVSQDNAIAASHSHDVVLADNLAPKPRSPREQERVDSYLRQASESDVRQYRKRLCTPQAIADFYSGHGGYEPLPKGP